MIYVLFYLVSFGPGHHHIVAYYDQFKTHQECQEAYLQVKKEKGASKFECVEVHLK